MAPRVLRTPSNGESENYPPTVSLQTSTARSSADNRRTYSRRDGELRRTVVPSRPPGAYSYARTSANAGSALQVRQTPPRLIDTDPQAYATSHHRAAEDLVSALRRSPLLAASPAQQIQVENAAVTFRMQNGTLEEWDAERAAWASSSRNLDVVYCDHFGILRNGSGAEIGRLGLEPRYAGELRPTGDIIDSASGACAQGVFLCFSTAGVQATFHPKISAQNGQAAYGPAVAYDPAALSLNGHPTLVMIGTPPSGPAESSFRRTPGVAYIDSIVRDAQGSTIDYSAVNQLNAEVACIPVGQQQCTLRNVQAISSAITRKREDLFTGPERRNQDTNEVTDNGQRYQYLTFIHPFGGGRRCWAVGVNEAGDAMVYTGAQVPNHEDSRENGWLRCTRLGIEHLFIRSDFTIVHKSGRLEGTIDPLSISTRIDSIRWRRNTDGSTNGMFLTAPAKIILNCGDRVLYHPESLGFGESRCALFQFGDPPHTRNIPASYPVNAELLFLLDTIQAGGMLPEYAGRVLQGAQTHENVYLSRDGSLRLTVDSRALSQLAELRVRLAALPQENPEYNECLELLTELAQRPGTVLSDRRIHIWGRNLIGGSSLRPECFAVWEPECQASMNLSQLNHFFPELIRGSIKANCSLNRLI